MPVSMSSAVAKPDSIIRIADSRYGTSRALTTKPARSWLRMTFLPSRSVANCSAVFAVSGDVIKLVTSSTSRRTGTGLKKWIPTTCSGRAVAIPSFMIGIELVFVARIAWGSVTTLSRPRKTSTFSASSSITASMTNWRSASSPRSVVNRSRPTAASRSSSVSFPDATPRSSDRSTRAWPASAAAASISLTMTSSPARADTSAIPAPINPEPTTPMRSMSLALTRAQRTGALDAR